MNAFAAESMFRTVATARCGPDATMNAGAVKGAPPTSCHSSAVNPDLPTIASHSLRDVEVSAWQFLSLEDKTVYTPRRKAFRWRRREIPVWAMTDAAHCSRVERSGPTTVHGDGLLAYALVHAKVRLAIG
ncbi:hypothetical protein [Curtobacterium sp. 18060]|uniref:hypothetical protein n=1 Tax=Curtobacterium sp. 18060 TaxID=2681408 RepID=UPI001F19F87E|nr:hypothetical protein [Curtobacterium sp. 18060]